MRPGIHLIIWYAICLHCLWAVLLLSDGAATRATPVHVYAAVPRLPLAAILLIASGFAAYGVTRTRPTRLGLAALLPQQALLTISAAGAVTAVILGHYGDGVSRPRAFILADQAPVMLAMLMHTAAVLSILVVGNRLAMVGSARGSVHDSIDRLSAATQDQDALSADTPGSDHPGMGNSG